jgi:hypothetical protein
MHVHAKMQAPAASTAAELSPLFKQALDAGLAALQAELSAATDGLDDASWAPVLDALEPVKVTRRHHLCLFLQ